MSLEVGGHRRQGLRKSIERVPDRPGDAHARTLAAVHRGPIASTQTGCPRQLGDEVVAIAFGEFDAPEVVGSASIVDVVVDVRESTAVRL